MLRTVNAIRYVRPLREGGSLPGLIEADDGRLYVVKLRGAGQGVLALVAEIIAGEMARSLGLNVPEIVLVQLDPVFGRQEPDAEIRELLKASAGLNVGLAFLAESTIFDPAAGDTTTPSNASLVVWLDAFLLNVDRTPRNANLLQWRGGLWLIDHGAALYFHHNWPTAAAKVTFSFPMIREHILLPFGGDARTASSLAHSRLTAAEISRILDLVPSEWLHAEGNPRLAMTREEYLNFFTQRLAASSIFEEEIANAGA